MAQSLKVGDVVSLNSEPNVKMTVSHVEGGYVRVVYYNRLTNQFEEHKFPVETLYALN